MHELSICLELLKQVEKVADENSAKRVERILLRVGPLSGVEGPLLQRAWPLASAGTRAADAELVVEPTEITVRCTQCDAVSEVVANRLLCSSCGDYRTCLTSGDELLLASIDLSVTEQPVQHE